jgi:hypothetical protein
MKWRAHLTSIALAIAAAVAVGYAWVDRESVSESEKKQREGAVFVGWRREAITRVVIEHEGGERIVLERTPDDAGGSDWWMREPFAERAEADAADKLVAAMEFATVVRAVDPTLKAPGLDAPRAKGTVVMGGLVHTFALGADAPTPAGAAYAKAEDGRTVVVSKDFVAAAMQRADVYRSRRIVPYLSVELARLEVKTESASFVIDRADDVSFKLAPSGLRASRSKLDQVWSAFVEMRAESFLPDAKGEALTATPKATVTMTPASPSMPRGEIRLGGECENEGVVAMRTAPTKLATCVPRGALAGLAVSDAALVDTRLFAAHDDEIAELRIEALGAGGAAIELARKESGWHERAPVDRDLAGDEAEAASALVSAVAAAEGADPAKSDAPFEAKGRVTVHRADKDAVEVVEISAPDAQGDVVARRTFDGARLHVGAAVARKLMPRGVALRGREVWTPRIEGAPARAIESKCGDVDQRVEKQGDRWVMVKPAGFGADNAAVVDAVDAVERARADAWVADADDGHFGLGACTVAVTFGVEGGERTARIDLGREGEGGVYARTADGVFVAPKGLAAHARAWLVDQHGLAPPPPVVSVSLERGGKHVALAADAGDDEATEDALRVAGVLRADTVVHLGPPRAEEGLTHPSLVATLRAPSGSRRVTFGAEVPGAESRAFFARVDGTDATFTVDRDRIKDWLARF